VIESDIERENETDNERENKIDKETKRYRESVNE
jgi:hypothetical protein